MAYTIKNAKSQTLAKVAGGGNDRLSQYVQVRKPTQAPTSTSKQLFRVRGGRVLVRGMLGEVTTIIQNSDPVIAIASKALNEAGVAVGTAVTIASTVNISSAEVGSLIWVEGDGSALVLAVAGCAFLGANSGLWIAPRGEIYITTTTTKTGSIQWDLWYEPLDPGAYVDAVIGLVNTI